MKWFLILVSVGLLGFCFWMYLQIDHPVSVGEKLTGLDIPRRTKAIHFKRESNDFNGDGYVLIVLSLDNKDVGYVERQCVDNGYMDFKKSKLEDEPMMAKFYDRGDAGLWKVIEKTSETYTIAFLNKSKNRLIVYSLNQ